MTNDGVGSSLRRGERGPRGRSARKWTARDQGQRSAQKSGVESVENSTETRSRNLPRFFPFSTHSGGCAGLVGADVVKNSGHEKKPGERGRWMMCNVCTCSRDVYIVSGRAFIPHCYALPSLFYKRREGPLVKGLPILIFRVHQFCLGLLQ